MSSRRIDLHTHSTCSDGADSPEELVRLAIDARLDVVALTDHDTFSGLSRAEQALVGSDLVVVPGIELSAQIIEPDRAAIPRSVHLLGYFVDTENQALASETEKIRAHRADRLRLMVEKLQADFDLSWDDVKGRIAPGATPVRPHIAQVMIDKGFVRDTTEAFAGPLRSGGPYHVPHYAPRLHTALGLLRSAGGVPILAHPYTDDRSAVVDHSGPFDQVVARYQVLVEQGLAGLEVYHREHSEAAQDLLLHVARELDLIVTGSSDYHGEKKPNQLGENLTAEEQYERLKAMGGGRGEITG